MGRDCTRVGGSTDVFHTSHGEGDHRSLRLSGLPAAHTFFGVIHQSPAPYFTVHSMKCNWSAPSPSLGGRKQNCPPSPPDDCQIPLHWHALGAARSRHDGLPAYKHPEPRGSEARCLPGGTVVSTGGSQVKRESPGIESSVSEC